MGEPQLGQSPPGQTAGGAGCEAARRRVRAGGAAAVAVAAGPAAAAAGPAAGAEAATRARFGASWGGDCASWSFGGCERFEGGAAGIFAGAVAEEADGDDGAERRRERPEMSDPRGACLDGCRTVYSRNF